MKVRKEEITGILAAVEEWSHTDLVASNRQWNKRADRIANLVETVPGVTAEIEIPKGGNSHPTATVKWDEGAFGLTVAQCDEERRAPESCASKCLRQATQPGSGRPGRRPQEHQTKPV